MDPIIGLTKAVGKLEGITEEMGKDLDNYRQDKKDLYRRMEAVEHAVESLPTKEEWAVINSMAKAQAARKAFWADLQGALAKRGILAAIVIFLGYSWEGIWAAVKSKIGG